MERYLSEPAKVLYLKFTPVLASFIILANTAQLYYIFRGRRARKNNKGVIFVASLAVVNLLLGLNILIVKVFDTHISAKLGGGGGDRKTVRYIYYFFKGQCIQIVLHVSVLNIVASTAEKCMVVVMPFVARGIGTRVRYVLLFLVWTSSITGVVFMFLYSKTYRSLIYLVNTIGIVFSVVVESVCFAMILITIRRSRRAFKNASNKESKTRSYSKHERLFINLIMKTYLSLVVLWLPYTIFAFMRMTGRLGIDYNWNVYVHSVAFFNSLSSPLIFFHHHCKWKIGRCLASKRDVNRSATNLTYLKSTSVTYNE